MDILDGEEREKGFEMEWKCENVNLNENFCRNIQGQKISFDD